MKNLYYEIHEIGKEEYEKRTISDTFLSFQAALAYVHEKYTDIKDSTVDKNRHYFNAVNSDGKTVLILIKRMIDTFLGEKEFVEVAKRLVMDYTNAHMDATDHTAITIDDVYVVLQSFILGNIKATLSTTVTDGMYYEITYNMKKGEFYFDAYKKFENKKYDITDLVETHISSKGE